MPAKAAVDDSEAPRGERREAQSPLETAAAAADDSEATLAAEARSLITSSFRESAPEGGPDASGESDR